MKIPKQIKRYCPKCKVHTDHKVSQAKRRTPGSAHPLAKSQKIRSGFGKGFGNQGKYGSKPAVSKFKMTGAKTSKKTDFRYQCAVCKKTQVGNGGKRSKKVEIV